MPRLSLGDVPCRMMQLPLEGVDALDVGHPPAAGRTDGRDQDVRDVVCLHVSACTRTCVGVCAADADAPLAAGGVVLGADDLVIEFDVLHSVVLLCDLLEVLLDLVARGVEG